MAYEHVDESIGIDYDLAAAFEYNGASFDISEIAKVLAVWEGERDVENWHWIVALKNGKFAYLTGGCDYTGWDCQSWLSDVVTGTLEEARLQAANTMAPDQFSEMVAQLAKQEKAQTWDEMVSGEFPKRLSPDDVAFLTEFNKNLPVAEPEVYSGNTVDLSRFVVKVENTGLDLDRKAWGVQMRELHRKTVDEIGRAPTDDGHTYLNGRREGIEIALLANDFLINDQSVLTDMREDEL